LIVLALVPVIASARSPLERAVRLSPRVGAAIYPQIASDGAGGWDAVWMQSSRSSSGALEVVGSGWTASSGRWSAMSTLSVGREFAIYPVVAAGPSGSAAVVWQKGGESFRSPVPQPVVEASYRDSPSGRWQRPVKLSRGGLHGADPEIAFDARGDAIALWKAYNSRESWIESSTRSARGGSWSAPVRISSDHDGSPAMFVSPDGTVVGVWEHYRSGGVLSPGGLTNLLYASVKPAGHRSWTAPVLLGTEHELSGQSSATTYAPGPRAAINSDDVVFVAWQSSHNGTIVPQIAVLDHASRWRHVKTLRLAAGLDPVIAADGSDQAAVVWAAQAGIGTATISAAGRLISRQLLARGQYESGPEISADSAGDVIAAWNNGDSVEAAVKPTAASWCKPATVGFGGIAQAAINPGGFGQVVWQRPTEHPKAIVVDARLITPCHAA
jgi:hypothetical protein